MQPAGRSDADRDAFDALFKQHHRAVLAYALRRTRLDEDAEDAAAEAFVVAWRRFQDVPADPLPWLYGVARRVLANQRRGGQRRSRLVERLSSFRTDELRPTSAAQEPAIEALERLGAGDRELLRLAAWEDLTHAQIATVLGITPNAVAIRLHRARKRFAEALTAITAQGQMKESESSRTSPSVRGRVAGMWRRGSAR